MSNMGNSATISESSIPKEEAEGFRRKLQNFGKYRMPRQYVIALLLCLLLFIKKWRNTNVVFILTKIVFLNDAKDEHVAVGNWTLKSIDNYMVTTFVVEFITQIPGAILVFLFGSHKYFVISTVVSSIFHMLTPTTLLHHSASLLFVLLGQVLADAPVFIAIFTIWKDWAPPSDRTKLVVFSMFGIYVEYAASTFYVHVFEFIASYQSFYYAGIAGLIWALFWYNLTSDTPQNDPFVSDQELMHLESNIPTEMYQKIRLKDVPWKSIITSNQVLIICIIFLKTGFSAQTMRIAGVFFLLHLKMDNHFSFFIPFLITFVTLIPCSAIIADLLLKKHKEHARLIRKGFVCGGFILQCIFMVAILSPSENMKAIFFVIAYGCYGISLSGFMTLPLDLAPRFVSIIAGIVYTSFGIAPICFKYFAEFAINFVQLHTVSWLFLLDGAFSLTSAALFAKWGDVEEQLWSQNIHSSRRTSSFKSFPKPDDRDDLSIVTSDA